MAGRPQELTQAVKRTVLLEQSQVDKLLELYGTYGVSRIVRQLIDEHLCGLGEDEPQDTTETIEFGSVVQL